MSAIIPLLLATIPLVGGQPDESMRVIIEQALDQPTTLTIKDAPLHEAFHLIAESTGLGVTIGPEALASLPYGESTRVSVRLENVRLRDGIRSMCDSLAMTYDTTKNGIEIIPSPGLQRLGRAATWEELEVLSALMQAEWHASDNDAESIRPLVRFKNVPGSPDENWLKLQENLHAAGQGVRSVVLTEACASAGWTWHPWGNTIVVLPIREQVLRQLDRPISLRCNNRPLGSVLRRLSRRAGIPVKIDPAAAAELSAKVKQSFSLLAENVTVAEALDQIGIATGLAYEVTEEAVVLHRPETGSTGDARDLSAPRVARRVNPIVGKVVIPSADGKYRFEWIIRASDLNDEENLQRQKLVDEAVKAMKEELANN